MISTLNIKNIGIIDDITINFNNGLNILTGETGAGKTLIIGALSILAGGRFSKEMIRNGEEYSYVELCLYIPENKNSIDGNIIISREIYLNGRNMCKINGRLVTVNELKNFMQNIIDIHGQNDNQTLFNISEHIKLLDEFSGKELSNIKNEYMNLYSEYINIKEELKRNYGDEKEKQRKLDLLKYQINEIEMAKLKIGEEEELMEQRKVIANSEKISENLQNASSCINENAVDSIYTAIRCLEKIQNINLEYSNILESLKGTYYEIEEIGRDIEEKSNNLEFDKNDLEMIENRLNIIYSLKRKYGNNVEEILNYKENKLQEINTIENLEEYTNQLKKQLLINEEQMLKLCIKMNEIRNLSANIITEKINKELEELEMKNAKFEVKIEFNNEKIFTNNGLDKVEFLISSNIGEEPKPLNKIASGGEISRIMLAIKNVLAEVDKVDILVFDEIDTGISGIAANSVGNKLKKISKNHQVLCVTHLASIAAKADYNYYISKKTENNKTSTKIKLLNENESIQEIARIASGEITEISLKHALELRKKAS